MGLWLEEEGPGCEHFSDDPAALHWQQLGLGTPVVSGEVHVLHRRLAFLCLIHLNLYYWKALVCPTRSTETSSTGRQEEEPRRLSNVSGTQPPCLAPLHAGRRWVFILLSNRP